MKKRASKKIVDTAKAQRSPTSRRRSRPRRSLHTRPRREATGRGSKSQRRRRRQDRSWIILILSSASLALMRALGTADLDFFDGLTQAARQRQKEQGLRRRR